MKKLFIFLTMLVLGIVSSWADETYTIIDSATGGIWTNGSYSSDNGSSNWKRSWTSTSTTPQITVSAHTFLLQNSTGYIGSSSSNTGKYTIKINEGYLITGYEITFKNNNTDGSHDQTITPNGGSAVTAEGTGSATVTVTGLNTRAAYFKLTGENTFATVTKFTITYKVDSDTWTSNVTGVGGDGNYYSDTWYIKLTTPTVNDVFLDKFTLGFASDGTHDTEFETYLAFSQGKFSEQNNHKASEFLAISSNSISGHSSATVDIKEFIFDETLRLNGNTDVYVCFVSKNVDGTYNLQKRGLAVKNIGKASGLIICKGNNYTTSETSCGNYQCQYSCTYSISHDYPQTAPSNYYIWSGINDGDKTSGGKITVAYIKYTAPGTSGQFVHFDRFSLDFRTDNTDNPYDKYLLFSKERLTGTGVDTSTEFDSSKFTAISTNTCTKLGAFMFAFDSDSYLEGGETYYIYMGTKLSNGNFTLVKYGIFINHQMDQRYISTGFQYSGALETQGPTTNNNWQPIYYSSKCTFADSKIALNIKEADKTIRTRTIYANDDVDVKTALNIPIVFTVTPASITHSAGATSQDVNINASFVPSSAPATEANHRYFFKLHGKYAGGDDGKTLSASTDMSEKDQWTFGGNYYDGYTIYNVGQGKYLSVSNADNSQGTFVDEASAAKFIVATSGSDLSFRLHENGISNYCYLNNRYSKLSTWKDSRGATDDGSRVVIEDPLVSLLSDFMSAYNDVDVLSGTTLGKYTNPNYTQEQVETAISSAATAYTEKNARDFISSLLALNDIKSGWTLNMPENNTFIRIKSHSRGVYLSNSNNEWGNIKKTSTEDGKETIYLYKDNKLIDYDNGNAISARYGSSEQNYFATMGDVNSTPATINFSAATERTLYNIGFNYADTDRSFKINEYASDAGNSGQTGGDYDFILEEVTSLPLTLAANSYTSFSAPVAVTIPDGCHAYVATSTPGDSYITMTEVTGNVPANQGLIIGIGTDATANPTFAIYSGSSKDLVDCSGNMLVANVAASNVDKANNYFFGKVDGNDNYVFAKISGTGTRTLGGHKAYLHYEKGTNARMAIIWEGDDPTGIEGLQNESVEMKDGKYYQNGKVVVVRNGVKYNVAGQIIK